jgi:hypothetical protein
MFSTVRQIVKGNSWAGRVAAFLVRLPRVGGARLDDEAAIPAVFSDWKYVAGHCNICGKSARFFYQEQSLYREQLSCEHCRSTSRYRSIARGLLEAIRETAGIEAQSLAELPTSHTGRRIRIYDTQPPFRYDPCAYPIPEYLGRCEWIDLHLSSYTSDLPLGSEKKPGVTNQDLERLTFADDYFDIVITSDVMEHVRLDARAHAEIARVLRPGGVYFFTVPHNWEWSQNLIRVRVDDEERPETDVFVLEPEYHGDANADDGAGVLSYRAYGQELERQLRRIGLNLRYEKVDLPALAIMNTELFYCKKADRSAGRSAAGAKGSVGELARGQLTWRCFGVS